MSSILRKLRRNKSRAGSATIELAICLPVIVTVVFGAIEGSSLVFLRQTLVQASYEGIKVAVDPEATNRDAIAAARQVTNGRNLENVTIQFEPRNIRNLHRGTEIRITLAAPGNANSPLPIGLFNNRTIRASAVMVKE